MKASMKLCGWENDINSETTLGFSYIDDKGNKWIRDYNKKTGSFVKFNESEKIKLNNDLRGNIMSKTPESKSVEAILKFYIPENQEEFWMATHAHKMWICLYQLDQKMRNILKHEENLSEGRIALAEEVRQFIWDNVNLDKMS